MSSVKKMLEKNGLKPTGAEPNPNNPEQGGEGGGENIPGEEATTTADTPPALPELTDEELLEALRKRGKTINSIDELTVPPPPPPPALTEEEQRQAREKRSSAVREYALRNAKVTTTQFDEYAREAKMPDAALGFSRYKAERIEELIGDNIPEADWPTDDDLQAEFNESYFQYADATDAKRKRAEARLKRENDEYLKEKYPNIFSLEKDYDTDMSNQTARSQYNTVLDEVFAEIPGELTFEIPDDKGTKHTYKFKVSDEARQELRAAFSTDDSFALFGQDKASKQDIQAGALLRLKANLSDAILMEVAQSHAATLSAASAKGRRQIPEPNGPIVLEVPPEKKVPAGVKKLVDKPANQKIIKK